MLAGPQALPVTITKLYRFGRINKQLRNRTANQILDEIIGVWLIGFVKYFSNVILLFTICTISIQMLRIELSKRTTAIVSCKYCFMFCDFKQANYRGVLHLDCLSTIKYGVRGTTYKNTNTK